MYGNRWICHVVLKMQQLLERDRTGDRSRPRSTFVHDIPFLAVTEKRETFGTRGRNKNVEMVPINGHLFFKFWCRNSVASIKLPAALFYPCDIGPHGLPLGAADGLSPSLLSNRHCFLHKVKSTLLYITSASVTLMFSKVLCDDAVARLPKARSWQPVVFEGILTGNHFRKRLRVHIFESGTPAGAIVAAVGSCLPLPGRRSRFAVLAIHTFPWALRRDSEAPLEAFRDECESV